jgi:hypothetical protein
MSEEAAPENGHETSEMRLHRQLISLARFSRSRLQRSTMLQQLEEQITSDADVRLCIATYKGMCAVRIAIVASWFARDPSTHLCCCAMDYTLYYVD